MLYKVPVPGCEAPSKCLVVHVVSRYCSGRSFLGIMITDIGKHVISVLTNENNQHTSSIQLHWLQFPCHLLLSLITGSVDQVIAATNLADVFVPTTAYI